MSAGESGPGSWKGRWWLRRWHRQLGVIFALPLLWLAVSGLLLRHADRLGLHDRQVRSAWLLQRYGMIPQEAPRGAKAGSLQVVEWGENLFMGGVLVQESGVLIGAVPMGRDLVVALEDYLLVYDSGGMLVDQLGDASLPGTPLDALGVDRDGAVMVRTGGTVARIGDDFLGHAGAPAAEVTWSEVTALEEAAIEALELRLAEQAGISHYRVLLDMHSGNLLGAVTKWAVDLAAIGIIVLTVMGLGLGFRNRQTGSGEG